MTTFSRALLHFVSAMAAMAVTIPVPADSAPPRRVAARTTGPKPVEANNGIIALPLNPILPAGQRLCALRTPSGLGYTMLRPASGAKPVRSDVALVNYIGYLAATGAFFDQGMRSPLAVDGVIPGFSEALQMMAKTAIGRFCIPAALGYGGQGAGPIPANSDLVFQVELIDYKPASQVESIRGAQAVEPSAP